MSTPTASAPAASAPAPSAPAPSAPAASASAVPPPGNPLPPSLPEEVFDRAVTWLEQKANPRAERLFKSKLLLVPCGVFWTAWARSYLAMRDLKPSRLIKRPDVDVVKGLAKEGGR